MTFIDAVKTCFSKYVIFTDRASRSEFWWFYLFVFVGCFIPVFGKIFFLVIFIPTIAVTNRRLHDVDRSGWWQVAPLSTVFLTIFLFVFEANILATAAGLAALVCTILLIVWLIRQGTSGPNRFGSDPLDGQNTAAKNYSPSSIPKVK
ncbi:MAG: DUF805 domain-containing protein [Paracoccaceae bacterium]